MNKKVYYAEFDDNLYNLSVYRTEPYKAKLIVTNKKTNEILLEEETGLSFNAVFGADYHDAQIWKQKALDVVDNKKV